MNTITILIAYLLTIWFFWRTTRKGQYPPVQPTPRTITIMAIKLLILYSLLWLLCWHSEINAISVLLVIGLSILVLLCTFSELAAPFLVVGYVLLQWILGFPDKELWIPPNKPFKQTTDLPGNLLGKTGTTQTPLRPTGTILIEQTEYTAKSEMDYIDKDTLVEITNIINGTPVVNPA